MYCIPDIRAEHVVQSRMQRMKRKDLTDQKDLSFFRYKMKSLIGVTFGKKAGDGESYGTNRK